MKKVKFCILVIWASAPDKPEVYNNLKVFTNKFVDYSYNTVNNYLSRKNEPFADEKVKIERSQIIF